MKKTRQTRQIKRLEKAIDELIKICDDGKGTGTMSQSLRMSGQFCPRSLDSLENRTFRLSFPQTFFEKASIAVTTPPLMPCSHIITY